MIAQNDYLINEKIKISHILFIVFIFCFNLVYSCDSNLRIDEEIPDWMKEQIDKDLNFFKNQPISLSKVDDLFRNSPHYLLVKFIIKKNEIFLEANHDISLDNIRLRVIKDVLTYFCQTYSLPDTTFLFSMRDRLLEGHKDAPIFVMSSLKDHEGLILTPDFEALNERYQVLKDIDLTQYTFPWETKHSQLIWRGSTAQHDINNQDNIMREDSLHLFSRVRLCELSSVYPHLINAKFTFYAQGAQNIPYVQSFRGNWIDFEDQVKYKYHLLIDGNTTAYSNSGWKFFINSLLFKEESLHVQWYYHALIPYVHYVPVKLKLTDLPEKILWAQEHDDMAKEIAWKMVQFARNHITLKDNLTYFYHLINEYSQLVFEE